ncbi:MAG: MBL fold metallo-hydrolase [Pelagimonas sp.]|nr:MBL fold metallo-hydrolase [Pelagimonas sp.]
MTAFTPTRRQLLTMAAAMPALTLSAKTQAATLTGPEGGNPAHVSFMMGDAKLTVISDGRLETPAGGLGVNADPEQVKAFLKRHFLSETMNYNHCNHLLVELGEAKVLVDVGSGDRFLDTAGQLIGNMEAAGIDPGDITHVVITHAHPDHIWGVRDDFDEAIIPDAQYFIGEKEYAHWTQDGLAASAPPEAQQFIVGAVNSLNVDGVDWVLATHDQEIAPGVRVIDTPGHTPGHLAVVVESNGQQIMALGDCMNHAYMNFAHPGWYNGFDMDGDQTVATRKRLLDMAATDRIAVLGYHFPFPGVGHVAKSGDAYSFVPAMWQW